MRKSTQKSVDRPAKPYADFPLFAHATGRWAKKIRGKLHYFGRWARGVSGHLQRVPGDGWQEALDEYNRTRDDLHAGRRPRPGGLHGPTVADVLNAFLDAKERQRDAGELSPRSFGEYHDATDRIVSAFGKDRPVDDLRSDDFADLRAGFAKRWGPARVAKYVQMVRTVFKFGYDVDIIDRPVRFGPEFKMPSASVKRRHRASRGSKMLEADDLRRLIDTSAVPMRAMILLGLNCGFGNHDVATLPMSAVDLDAGWIDFPRPKTGIPRRVPLWPETIAAIHESIKARPNPKTAEAADFLFLTVRGRPWLSRGIANPVGIAARRLMKTAGVHRPGIGFYTLRHVFRTVADGAKDQVAATAIMGHADDSMSAVYRERIDDDRLRAVVDHVHAWLFTA